MLSTVVLVGDVDHGKSSLLGRLACELKVATDQHLARLSKDGNPNYALILDALDEERRDDRTIGLTRFTLRKDDVAIRFLDAPGHSEFVRSLITGLSVADTALLVVSAVDGVTEAFKRQITLLQFFERKRIVLAVTKSDLVEDKKVRISEITKSVHSLIEPLSFSGKVELSSTTGEGFLKLADLLFNPNPKIKLDSDSDSKIVSITGTIKDINFGTPLGKAISNGDILVDLSSGAKVEITKVRSLTSSTALPSEPFLFHSNKKLKRGDILVSSSSDYSEQTKIVDFKYRFIEDLGCAEGLSYELRIGAKRYKVAHSSLLRFSLDPADAKIELLEPIVVPKNPSACYLNRALIEKGSRVVGIGILHTYD
jgi:small GTP-binding protein